MAKAKALSSEEVSSLSISAEKICFVIIKAREFGAKDVVTEPDPGSNSSDDAVVSVLEDYGDDPFVQELTAFIQDLNEDEQIDLVALAWLGRGDSDLSGWGDLREEAARAHNSRTAAYLLGMPLFPDYLEEALSLFGQSCEEFELGRL